jgi:hypothetical protein
LFQPEADPKVVAEAKAKAAKRYAMEERARASLPTILKEYSWDYGLLLDSSKRMWPDLLSQTYNFLNLFKEYDTIWIGDPQDSGRRENIRNFGLCSNFQDDLGLYTFGRYTTASTYSPGVWSRANENVKSTPFLIVEGDQVLGKVPETDEEKLANKNACAAIFRWLSECVGLNLRAIVDSGNKSLHGWFEMPSATKLEELKIVLPAMGCDRAMFKPSQPARLPGVLRENGNEQRLLFLR